MDQGSQASLKRDARRCQLEDFSLATQSTADPPWELVICRILHPLKMEGL